MIAWSTGKILIVDVLKLDVYLSRVNKYERKSNEDRYMVSLQLVDSYRTIMGRVT